VLLMVLVMHLDYRKLREPWLVYALLLGSLALLVAVLFAAPLLQSEVLTAELVYALTVEWAQSLEDVLQRRCMAGLAADFGLRTAPAAAAALEQLGIWDAARAARELADYRELAARHGAR
ncbi:MAG TPA: glycerol-3-phosphate dehydrogenase C-terminal domain-containing protein, partial [Gammaproteobacteria bacterium]|nr:glycerol-3-phosphate dehydrogenase C-terminal domain-containing protein [Gammaproteobacteria bacterium]